jgi:hypothetical protein
MPHQISCLNSKDEFAIATHPTYYICILRDSHVVYIVQTNFPNKNSIGLVLIVGKHVSGQWVTGGHSAKLDLHIFMNTLKERAYTKLNTKFCTTILTDD